MADRYIVLCITKYFPDGEMFAGYNCMSPLPLACHCICHHCSQYVTVFVTISMSQCLLPLLPVCHSIYHPLPPRYVTTRIKLEDLQ